MKKENDEMEDENATTKPYTRRYTAIAAVLFVTALVAVPIVRRQEAHPTDTAVPDARPEPNTIEATPEQLKQIRVEPVRDQAIEEELETTGKVGFNEDRLSPVFAPYSGRVLEVLANKGDIVKS